MKRIVVKLGSNVISDKHGKIDEAVLGRIVAEIAHLVKSGIDTLLVTSGAISSGMGLLNITKRPAELCELQALASIGQAKLMQVYDRHFYKHDILTAQILLTQDDFNDRERYLNIKYTVNTVLAHKAVPIINENDTISTKEIKCGDNDRLSALLADLIDADGLVLLSSVDGLLDNNGKVIGVVEKVDDKIKSFIKEDKSCMGTGGMSTKISAAEFVTKSGIDCFIANGKKENILTDILSWKGTFTRFKACQTKISARKRWISFGVTVKGNIVVDDGAKNALIAGGKSLLAAGIVGVKGDFHKGDIVAILDKKLVLLARGITSYSADEVKKIKGVKTKDIKTILGYKDYDEVVHRDNLVLV